jgi:hypothetical protein
LTSNVCAKWQDKENANVKRDAELAAIEANSAKQQAKLEAENTRRGSMRKPR